MNKYFCILGGGGIRGAAYTGALKALKDLNIEITGYAGSSIGAVVAGLLTFKYDLDEIQEIFDNINLEFFKDINLTFNKDFALSKGENFYEWIKNKLKAKCGYSPCFKDIEDELIIFSVDLVSSKFFEFSKYKTPNVEIAHAIRVSVGMPGLYKPVFEEDECLVDGDLLKSMPLFKVSENIYNRKEKILEFRLEDNETKKKITNTIEYLNAVYDATSGFASDFVINTYKNHDKCDFIKLNLEGISVVDFMANKDKKREMARKGYDTVRDYFKNFYPEKLKKINSIYNLILKGVQKTISNLQNKNILEARYETANILASVIEEKEIINKSLFSELVLLKKRFDENFVLKTALFMKKPVLKDKDKVLQEAFKIGEKIQTLINGGEI